MPQKARTVRILGPLQAGCLFPGCHSEQVAPGAMQAHFLIPMAIALGFGVLFVTPLTILLLPAAYYALEDVKGIRRKP